MPITTQSRATIKSANTKERQFVAQASVLASRKLLSGGFDPAKTAIVAGQKYQIFNAEDAAELFGYGSQLHRMALYHFAGATGAITTDCLPLPAAAGGAAGTRTVTFATNATAAGNYYFRCGSYLSDDLIKIGVASGATPAQIATLLTAAITALPNLPFTAVQGTEANAGVVTLTAKTADLTSKSLKVTNNIGSGESAELPSGMTVAIADVVEGAGSSAVTGLTAYLESESNPRYTSVVQPYIDTSTLDALKNVVGNPNEVTGLYDDLDYRPFSSFVCDTTGDNLATLIALGNTRKLDCANVLFAAPTYPELGYEIAAYISGFIDLKGIVASSNAYTGISLPLLWGPLTPADDWTTVAASGEKAYNNRNAAVIAGITPVIYNSGDGVAYPGDVTGFWHPQDNQNAPFKFICNRIKIWNVQANVSAYLNSNDLKDCPIVFSAAAVRQSERPVDADIIAAGLAEVAGNLENFAWIYQAEFTIANTTVTESDLNPDRFDISFPIIVSGNNRVNSAEIAVDRNLQAVTVRLVA